MNTKFNNKSKLLDTKETAKFLGVSPGTLELWRSTRRYPLPFVKVGRLVKYRISDLEKFLDDMTTY